MSEEIVQAVVHEMLTMPLWRFILCTCMAGGLVLAAVTI